MLLDKSFHTYLMEIIQFELFLKSYNVQHDLSILIGTQGLKSQGRMIEVIDEHNEIIKALSVQNEEAIVNTMKSHLEKIYDCVQSEIVVVFIANISYI